MINVHVRTTRTQAVMYAIITQKPASLYCLKE